MTETSRTEALALVRTARYYHVFQGVFDMSALKRLGKALFQKKNYSKGKAASDTSTARDAFFEKKKNAPQRPAKLTGIQRRMESGRA